MADVKKLVRVIDSDACEEWAKSAVKVGFPVSVQQQIKSVCSLDDRPLADIIVMARTLVTSEMCMIGHDRIRKCHIDSEKREGNNGELADGTRVIDRRVERRCFRCNKLVHIARFCESKRCYICNDENHVANQCPLKREKLTKND